MSREASSIFGLEGDDDSEGRLNEEADSLCSFRLYNCEVVRLRFL